MKYWVYLDGEVPGSYAPEELADLPGLNLTTLVCPAEGEILEKNWRHAAEFADIADLLRRRGERPPAAPGDPKRPSGATPGTAGSGTSPAAPGPAPAPAPPDQKASPAPAAEEPPSAKDSSNELERFLDTSSNRLFRHVSELMKELEVRREERSVIASLQRQIVELKEQGQKAREKAAILEDRMAVLPAIEETAKKNETWIKTLQDSLKASENALAELRVKYETSKTELENAKRRLADTANDLSIRNRLVDKLNKDLTEKELSLAKALAVIRRFEEEVGRICPMPAEPHADPPRRETPPPKPEPALPPAPPESPAPAAGPVEDPPRSKGYTTDEPTIVEHPTARVEPPDAKNAFKQLFKKYFSPGPGPEH
ncbi:MAG: hypothetical protein HY927_03990 [Elusimicrobia bacterium]|nr:hypothetical protein [Elusimicrobiota bacterium]